MEFTIEKATLRDLDAILELNHKLGILEGEKYDETVNPGYAMGREVEKYFRKRINDGFAYVAKISGKIVGFLVGGMVEAQKYRESMNMAEAETIFVLEEFRGKGIGKKLIEKFVDWARENKFDRIRIVCSAGNEGAKRLYEEMGFEKYDISFEREL